MINQRWLVYASSLGKHGVKTGIDLRRRFCLPHPIYGTKWNQWDMSFSQVFVTKTSIGLFSSDEHEKNLNKGRRQLQYFGRLISLATIMANFLWQSSHDIASFFRIVEKETKKPVGVLSRQAKSNKIFAKEARESYIKVIQDHSSFSCILQQICYVLPLLKNSRFYRKPI